MSFLRILLLCFAALLLATGCSSETTSATVYPNNPAISDVHGVPRDSTTFYFPAADSLPPGYIPPDKRPESYQMPNPKMMNCASELAGDSKCLVYFQAPVLFNYYLHATIYRFLWLRSFHRPVLLTLRKDSVGVTLRTQFLSKIPSLYTSTFIFLDPNEAGITPEEALRRKARMEDSVIQAHITFEKRRAIQITAEETTYSVTSEQWQHFEQMLSTAHFWQKSACWPAGYLDGAEWLLEAHRIDGYHAVLRQSPDEGDAFRAACEYLLDLSSARKEERY